MDMKKLLQVVDSASSKAPVGESSDIKRSLEIITEGANPHKVSLPVQMAMQHYQNPIEKKPASKTSGLIQKYFENVESEQQQALNEKREQLRMYSQKIAKRVLVKEAAAPADAIPEPAAPVQDPAAIAEPAAQDEVDTVTLDVPLMIRLLEYAREDAQTDMDLHNVAEQLIALSKEVGSLSMDQYDAIVGSSEEPVAEPEAAPMAAPEMPVAEACWKNYKQIGMKKKGGKTVPNCVPKK